MGGGGGGIVGAGVGAGVGGDVGAGVGGAVGGTVVGATVGGAAVVVAAAVVVGAAVVDRAVLVDVVDPSSVDGVVDTTVVVSGWSSSSLRRANRAITAPSPSTTPKATINQMPFERGGSAPGGAGRWATGSRPVGCQRPDSARAGTGVAGMVTVGSGPGGCSGSPTVGAAPGGGGSTAPVGGGVEPASGGWPGIDDGCTGRATVGASGERAPRNSAMTSSSASIVRSSSSSIVEVVAVGRRRRGRRRRAAQFGDQLVVAGDRHVVVVGRLGRGAALVSHRTHPGSRAGAATGCASTSAPRP